MKMLPKCKGVKPVTQNRVVSIPRLQIRAFAFPCVYGRKSGYAFACESTDDNIVSQVTFVLEDGTIKTKQIGIRRSVPHTDRVVEHTTIPDDPGKLLGLALYVVLHQTYFAAHKVGSNRYLFYLPLITKETTYLVHYATSWHRYRSYTVYLTEPGKTHKYVISFRQHWYGEPYRRPVLARHWIAHMWLC